MALQNIDRPKEKVYYSTSIVKEVRRQLDINPLKGKSWYLYCYDIHDV